MGERSTTQPWHAEIPDYLRRVKTLVPDISLRPLRWAQTEDGVLIEWEISGTFRDQQLSWRGADRFTLRGDRATEGVAYFDTHRLWVNADPSLDCGALENLDTAEPAGAEPAPSAKVA